MRVLELSPSAGDKIAKERELPAYHRPALDELCPEGERGAQVIHTRLQMLCQKSRNVERH